MRPNTTRILNIPLKAPLALKGGGKLDALEVACETYGALNPARDNAVLLCHPLSMDAHASNNDEPDIEPGWWNFFVGPGRAVDTRRYFVICTNMLGGCKGTTGPLSPRPGGGLYGTDFPAITVEDMVSVQRRALQELGIGHLHAVIGGSLGGMQVLEWAVRYPDFVDKAVAIATGAHLSPQGLAFDIVGRLSIMNDPEWKQGRYAPEAELQMTGLQVARMIGHITYISRNMMDRKFGRELQNGSEGGTFATAFTVESFLRYQGEKFVKRFDPNSYLYLSRAMDLYDLTEGHEDIAASLARSHCAFLVLSFSSDWLFPPESSLDIALALARIGRHVNYVCIPSELGHDAFLVEEPDDPQSRLVGAFLRS